MNWRRTRIVGSKLGWWPGALLLIALGGFESPVFSAAFPDAGKECVLEIFEHFEWNQSLWPVLGIATQPKTERRIGAKLNWSEVASPLKTKLGEFAIGACALRYPRLTESYRFRPLSGQLQSELQAWHEHPGGSPFLFNVASALSSYGTGERDLLVPMMASLGVQFLKENARNLNVPGIPVREILNGSFGPVVPLNSVDESKGAWFDLSNTLQLSIPANPQDLLLRLFHELCHAWSRTHNRVPDQISSPIDWVTLTLEDEFRAQVWTEEFEDAWSTQYGSGHEGRDTLANWRSFLAGLRLHSPEQRAAIHEFLTDFKSQPENSQRDILERWLNPN